VTQTDAVSGRRDQGTTSSERARVWNEVTLGALSGIGIALVANLVIFAVGDRGTPTRVVTGWSPDGADLTIFEVVSTTLVAVALGAVVLWRLDRRPNGFAAWTWVAMIVAVASALPLWRLDVDTASKATLTAMHLTTGAAAITGQAIVRRRFR
jgi:uncharacterized membrane protein